MMMFIDPQLLVTLLGAFAGLLGMPLIDAIKKYAGVSGNAALAIATSVSIALAVAVVAINGALSGMALTLPAIIEAAGVVFSVATILYKAITGAQQAK